MNSEHVEVLRELRDTGDVSDWRAMESALDAAITALSAPQPPAEAQPCGCGEATCTVPWEPGCGLGKSEQHAVVQAQAQGGGGVWRPMDTAPRDGTLLRLLVDFEDHATEDTADPAPTIGAYSFDNTGEDVWQFAGWCWSHDHFTEGKGTPVGWLPMLDTTPPSAPVGAAEDMVLDAIERRESSAPVGVEAYLVERLTGTGYGRTRSIVDAAIYNPTEPAFWIDPEAQTRHRVTPLVPALAQQPAAAPVSEAIASLPALWRLREDNGEEHTEYDKGFETASDECARMLEEALAQQPAAVFRNDGNSEADFIADDAIACTACGGSGHRDDQQPAPVAPVGVAERTARALLTARSNIGACRPDDEDEDDQAWWDELTDLAARAQQPAAVDDAIRRDADRYRWLRLHANTEWEAETVLHVVQAGGRTLDLRIDEALAAQQGDRDDG